jgi:CDP-diacylglycerol--glycerol-3-phosphate 3-phosphatidyltransferase
MANLITLSRVILLFMAIGLLYLREPVAAAAAVLLTIIVYATDALDGYVARQRGETTTAGGVFDTAGDRIVENVYWIVFAHLGLIAICIPLLMIARSFAVDAVRSLALAEGRTTFGETTMMESQLGRWMVASRLHRALYGMTKLVAQCLLAVQWWAQLTREQDVSLGRLPSLEVAWPWIVVSTQVLAWFAVTYGLARGALVLYDARHYLRNVPRGK